MTEQIFKILALCITVAALCIIVKPKNAEYALLISVAAGIIIGAYLLKSLVVPIQIIKEKLESYGIEGQYFKVALKAVGIGYVTSFIADVCRDSGQTSLAQKAVFAGKCAIFILSVPLMLSILDTAVGFLK